jgi:flagellar biosynthetic protein FliR
MEISWVEGVLLASVRLALGIAFTPLLTTFAVPRLARLVFVLSLAMLAAGSVSLPQLASGQARPWFLLFAAAHEVALGLLLGLGVHAAFAAFSIGGRLIDTQMGFALGAVFDPASNHHSTITSSGFNFLAVLFFFAADVHHLLLAAYFRSFELVPLGRPIEPAGWFPMVQGAGSMFTLGFLVASPVVVALWLADVVLGVLSRNMPQMNVMFLGFPVKVMLGLSILAASMGLMEPLFQKVLMLPVLLVDRVR